MLRCGTPTLKAALGDHAARRLVASSGQQEHGRAVCVLAYLGDDRLARHLKERLNENGSLMEYENHALIALGTQQAGEVFYESAKQAADELAALDDDDGGLARYEVHSRVSSAWSAWPSPGIVDARKGVRRPVRSRQDSGSPALSDA